jgi:hypothetical protein
MDHNFDKDVVDVMCDWVHMLEPIRAEDSDEPANRMFHKWRCPACNPRQIECKGGLWLGVATPWIEISIINSNKNNYHRDSEHV